MRLVLLSVGRRMPGWVEQGFQDYARRLPGECALELVTIDPVSRHGRQDRARCLEQEGERLLAALPKGARVVALDVAGECWSTATFAACCADWMRDGRAVALLVGGADGLAPSCLARAERCWSLSPLTFPHQLVRVILAEQIYRAWSLLRGHPYHRA